MQNRMSCLRICCGLLLLYVLPVRSASPSDSTAIAADTIVSPSLSATVSDGSGLIPPHHVWNDVSWAGIPWIATGLILRNDKENFREARNKFTYNFHHTGDDYSQYSPLLLTTVLKAAGYEGRSDWRRYLVSAAASYAVMGALINGVKYSAKELRPDGSTRNSFPSGHTATAFAAATILHKEYGLTRSPWLSAAGYAMATATGCMRVLNNRHWVSDVFAGAGVGILSTELGYALGQLLFKEKGLVRPDREGMNDLVAHPSFFAVKMGIGLGSQSIDFATKIPEIGVYYDEEPVKRLRLTQATVVGVESAYFPTLHVGIGAQLRVSTRSVKNWREMAHSPIEGLLAFNPQLDGFLDTYHLEVKSDHFSDFTLAAGPYFHFPVSRRMAIDTKLLLGKNYTQGINIDAAVSGRQRDIDLSYETENGKQFLVYEVLGDKQDNGKQYHLEWDYLSINADNALTLGTGLSLTFAYRSSMAWRLFADYDLAHRHYTVTYAPANFIAVAARQLTLDGAPVASDKYIQPYTTRIAKNISKFVVGGSFCVSF
jgi:membrane-associated phospholipid phosphatase